MYKNAILYKDSKKGKNVAAKTQTTPDSIAGAHAVDSRVLDATNTAHATHAAALKKKLAKISSQQVPVFPRTIAEVGIVGATQTNINTQESDGSIK